MTFSKIILIFAVILFAGIGVVAVIKKKESNKSETQKSKLLQKANSERVLVSKTPAQESKTPVKTAPLMKEASSLALNLEVKSAIPEVDRINELFEVPARFPLVETITYKARVPWLSGRSAWIADYASYYGTSRHFIARSLNRSCDYLTQKVAEGDTFNVLKRDKEIKFHLVADLISCKMLFYIEDGQSHEKTLLKTYNIVVGREDEKSKSGCLTPLGTYTLGSKVAIYKPGTMGIFHGETQEMIRIFGTRWIPFEKEVQGTTAPAKGFGIHGSPWKPGKDGNLEEIITPSSKYESDGCVRLSTQDMEELFSIIITKPTSIEIVKGIKNASVPVTP